jgi:hypothetical protein
MQNKAIVARLVGETLPLLEKYRREKAARGPEEQTDTFEDSDTIVRGMATVEIRGNHLTLAYVRVRWCVCGGACAVVRVRHGH